VLGLSIPHVRWRQWHAKGHPNEQEIARKAIQVLCNDHEEPIKLWMTLRNARKEKIQRFVVFCLLSRIIVKGQSSKAVKGKATMCCVESVRMTTARSTPWSALSQLKLGEEESVVSLTTIMICKVG
jgi:hypothetical protein